MDYTTLKKLNPAEFEGAADGYQSTSNMAQHAKEALERQITAKMREDLEGQALTAALGQLSELSKNFHYVQVECGLVSTGLNALAADLREAKRKLDKAVDDAEAQKFTVNSDGSVSYPAAGEKGTDGKLPAGGSVAGIAKRSKTGFAGIDESPDPAKSLQDQAANFNPNPNYSKAAEIANRIAQAIQEATESDELWAPKLRQLRADDDLTVSDEDWIDAKGDTEGVRKAAKHYLGDIKHLPKNGSPADNAKWWKGLSPDQQDALITLQPDSIGGLDGLPAEVRNEANRTVLAEKRAEIEIALARHNASEPKGGRPKTIQHKEAVTITSHEWDEWDAKRKRLEEQIKGMDQIQSRFDRTGGKESLPEAYLLGFSTEGGGRAIIANGNPDTADHAAVYVPGTKSGIGNLEGDINRMVKMYAAASPLVEGKNLSTVTWVGYDAPQTVQSDALSYKYADDGAPAFNKFIDGLNAANTSGADSRITAIGHSYGCTLIGSAARQGHLGADDIVFAGSPTVEVQKAERLDVPKGHVWNEDADGDAVPEAGRWFQGWLGPFGKAIPSDDSFGANQMATDTEGHSGYWDYDREKKEPSLSILNQARVVAGLYDEVELVDD
ncbi:alpha/beta hydrolase [Streptomyces sp. SAJ15]|uniref:alpha/beta hydrolase n=1 Tax=Streptomyces sp. SAJ15 TaxID=2011095 RepID=UPI001186E82D|nr:alpha/beta hydrolase [Streptomyces sp. SAJ15]TVL93965.1 hypothetical protein CD790_02800 [Streptomyces sp. SAJ15]